VQSGRWSSSNVTIKLKDRNDHEPVFASDVITADVLETAPENTEVVTVKASDADFNSLRHGNASILYRLSGYRS